jgi:hypothetical protein
MGQNSSDMWLQIADLSIKLAVLIIGGLWALFELNKYRALQKWIQLDIDAHLYNLSSIENVAAYTWDRTGKRVQTSVQPHTHVVEVLLKFTNKGKTRFKIYNAQIWISTMRPPQEARFDREDGHLGLRRLFTSGNLVPIMHVKDKPIEETSFYYIEPGVEQTVHFLALITEPRELVQVAARFSLEQERIFPEKAVGPKGLYPHTAVRTYQVGPEGNLINT